jgi:molybdopterin molybdotransferase
MDHSAKWKGFSHTMRVDEGLQVLFANTSPPIKIENVYTEYSTNRIIADDIIAPLNLPGFRRSAMDGYAIMAKDTYGASTTNPLTLTIQGYVEIGDTNAPVLKPNHAIRISTGAPLPKDATAVIKIEDCEEVDDQNLEVYSSISKGKNVAEMDEDVAKGTTIYSKDHRIRPWDIAMLTSLGLETINVLGLPKIAILATGSELIPLSETPKTGLVYDSNRPALAAWIRDIGAELIVNDSCEDDPQSIKEQLLDIGRKADLIITTGGTSVGKHDYMAEVIKEIGEIWTHGVAIRPGKPLILGKINTDKRKTPIIALPGYPLAAFLNFELFVIPLLDKWMRKETEYKYTKVKLAQQVPSTTGVRDFVRLVESPNGAKVLRITGAGILSSLVKADFLLEIPEDIEGYAMGQEVKVRDLRN